MPAILIDPHAKTVTPWEPPPSTAWLEALRVVIGCEQIDSVMVQDRLCLWFDNMGLLKGPNAYWSFIGNDHRFAGRGILTAVDGDGMPVALSLPPEDLSKGIDWRPDDKIERIIEELVVEATPFGPWPRVARKVLWLVPIEDTTPVEAIAWTVWDDDVTDGYKVIGPDKDERVFDSYVDARRWLVEKTLVEHRREPGDPEGLVATFLPE